MYKIIGADQKEYGPINADQMRQWIAEGRVGVQTSVQAEGGEWRPLQTFPEFADALAAKGAVTTAAPSGTTAGLPAGVLERDYELDIGSCVSRSWELVKKNFWPIVLISFLVFFIVGVINQVMGLFTQSAIHDMILQRRVSAGGLLIIFLTSLVSAPVYTILIGGLFKYYLKLIRGENATVGDAFAGFGPSAGQLLLLGLVQCVLVDAGFLLCIVPGIYLSVSWYLATPLVIDRQLGFWDAMELSRKVVSKHWFVVFGLLLVVGLITACGILACCIGIFVSIPIGLVAMMYAYEDIFSASAATAS
jgi:uncharacterized membrane protein